MIAAVVPWKPRIFWWQLQFFYLCAKANFTSFTELTEFAAELSEFFFPEDPKLTN